MPWIILFIESILGTGNRDLTDWAIGHILINYCYQSSKQMSNSCCICLFVCDMYMTEDIMNFMISCFCAAIYILLFLVIFVFFIIAHIPFASRDVLPQCVVFFT